MEHPELDVTSKLEEQTLDQSSSSGSKVKEEDDVISLLESIANRNKPYFEERWPSDCRKWRDKNPMEKFSVFTKSLFIITLILILIYSAIRGEDSVFYFSLHGDRNRQAKVIRIH